MKPYTQQPSLVKFGGLIYRSRLESRFACMFTLLGWEFAYEPFPLEKWEPDFMFRMTKNSKWILAEVKPTEGYFEIPKYLGATDFNEYNLALLTSIPNVYAKIFYSASEMHDFKHVFLKNEVSEAWNEAFEITRTLPVIDTKKRYKHP